ncbi:unnamed protein product [Phaeothamnion confervicola]
MSAVQRQAVEVADEAVLCVALCRGVVRASDGSGGGPDLGRNFVEPLLDGMVRLLRMHVAGTAAIVCEVLEFLKDVSEMHLPSMPPRRAIALYEACGKALKIYADHHLGRRGSAEPTAEEDAYQDISCVLQLLGLLVVKDFVDFGDDTHAESDQILQAAVPDVAFFGLSKVLPLMTEGLLQFPALAEQYLSLVGFMVESFADRLPGLEFELFHQLVQSLLFGSQQSNSSSARTSLKALGEVAASHTDSLRVGGPGLSVHLARWPTLIVDCLAPLLRMTVYEGFVWDRLDAAADAVSALVACGRGDFERLAAQIVAQQPSPEVAGRLAEAFRSLVGAGGEAVGRADRASRARFQKNMREFVTSVRAFLLVT